jgi:hypothetical protein
MVKAQRPEQWMLETLMSIHLSLDESVGSPGIALTATVPGRKGAIRHHWPSVQHRITPAQLDELEVAAGQLVRDRLLLSGFIQEVLPLD